MFLVPDWFIILVFSIAGGCLIVMGIIRWHFKLYVIWAWLAPSCFQTAQTYWFFLTHNIPVGERSELARLSFTSLGVSILTLCLISIFYSMKRK